jgi:hypothetical protein
MVAVLIKFSPSFDTNAFVERDYEALDNIIGTYIRLQKLPS